MQEDPATRLMAALRSGLAGRGVSRVIAPGRALRSLARRSVGSEPASGVHRERRRRSARACRTPEEPSSPAFGDETDVACHVRLHYLLSLFGSRRGGDVEAGLRHGREAVDTARRGFVESGLKQYLEAWARHAYGYALVRDGRIPEAVAQCQLALRRLEAAPAHPAVPPAEVVAARWYLFDDLARAAAAGGEAACASHWGRRRLAVARDVPASKWPAMSWPLPGVPRSAPQAARRG